MALSGKQKAAILLMSLDTLTAVELLKGLDTDEIQENAPARGVHRVEPQHLVVVGGRRLGGLAAAALSCLR
jgi:flagellar motor switch protein FliG